MELSKQIMKISKSKNIYFKWPSRENFMTCKNERCNNMTKYAKKAYFPKLTAKKGSKSFRNTIKPFFTNRGIMTNDSITHEENEVLESDPKETTEVFNNYYINAVETTSGTQLSSIGSPNSQSQDSATVKKKIIESYKNHPSVVTIKENVLSGSLSFDLPQLLRKI